MTSHPPLIVHVIHHLMTGGLENGLVNLINHMPKDRYRHAVVCIEDYSDFRLRINRRDVEVYALQRSKIGVWKLRLELYRLFRRLRPTIVHSRNLSGLDAIIPAVLARVPYRIHGEHGWDVDNLDGRKLKPLILRKLHSLMINRYIAVSKHIEQFLLRQVHIRQDRISQIYNGVDTRRFKPAQAFDGARDERKFVVGTIGRLQPIKDQATLIRAFSRFLQCHPAARDETRLKVVGDGPQQEALSRLIKELELEAHCVFFGPSEQVPDLLRLMDLFVLSSLNEGISNTILEAMATGLPVVATAVGGNMELIDDGINGKLFDPGDVDTLANLIAELWLSPRTRSRLGSNALDRAHLQFSLSNMVSSYIDIYDNICKPPC